MIPSLVSGNKSEGVLERVKGLWRRKGKRLRVRGRDQRERGKRYILGGRGGGITKRFQRLVRVLEEECEYFSEIVLVGEEGREHSTEYSMTTILSLTL